MAKKATTEKAINLDNILFNCRDILRAARNSGSFFEKRDMMLTLVFLRFIGEKYEDGIEKLKERIIAEGLDPEDENIRAAFFDDATFTDGTYNLPVEARWSTIINTPAPQLNVALDTALHTIATGSKQLKGCFVEGTFTTRNLAPNDIKKVVDEVNKISHKAFGEEKDLTVFRVKATDLLNSDYLFMYFNRPEFDRYARFNSWGSARETFDWSEFCDIDIELPDLPTQCKYVDVYNSMLDNQRAYEYGLDDLKLVCDGYIEDLRRKMGTEPIGPYIVPCDERNSNLEISLAQGITIDKMFANPKQVAVSERSAKIVRNGQFAYNRATTRNGEKISIAYRDAEDCVVSAAYQVFEIKKKEKLIPEYLKTVKRMRAAYDICQPSGELGDEESALAQCFMAIAGFVRKMSGTSEVDAETMNRNVSKMVEEALKYTEVESVLESGEQEDIFSPEYFEKLSDVKMPATKLELLVKMLKKQITEYGKTNQIEAKRFQEMLEKTIAEYHERRKHLTSEEAGATQEQASEDIIRSATEQALNILRGMNESKESFRKMGLTFEEKAFYDILLALRDQYNFEYGEDKKVDGVLINDKCKSLAKKVKEIIDTKSSFADWLNNQNVRNQLKLEIKICLIKNGYPPQYSPEVFTKVMEQVENFEENN